MPGGERVLDKFLLWAGRVQPQKEMSYICKL